MHTPAAADTLTPCNKVPEQGSRERPALWEGPAGGRGAQEGQSVDTPKAHLSAVRETEHWGGRDREGESKCWGSGGSREGW